MANIYIVLCVWPPPAERMPTCLYTYTHPVMSTDTASICCWCLFIRQRQRGNPYRLVSQSCIMHILPLLTLSLPFLVSGLRQRHIAEPEAFVNIRGGTDSRPDLSHGNVLPLIGRPWGFNTWAPLTDTGDGAWWFHPNDRHIYGIRCTHQPSPWIGDYGWFVVSASITDPAHSDPGQSSAYEPDKAIFRPSYFRADLLAYTVADGTSTSLEVTATSHGAIFRVRFPKYDTESGSGFIQTRQIMITLNGGSDSSQISETSDGATLITGKSTANSGGMADGVEFANYFAVAIYSGSDGDKPISHSNGKANSEYVSVTFDPEDPMSSELILRVATSFISVDQAIVNLENEVGTDKTFDGIVLESQKEWDEVLSRVDVKVPETYTHSEANDLYAKFYTAMYRASLFPRDISEIDSSGSNIHWSPYTSDSPQPGPLSSDSGFWVSVI